MEIFFYFLRTSFLNTIQHYSNPNVFYKGKATGVNGKRENWRQLVNNACTVANFRQDTYNPLTAYITGPSYGCPCFDVLFEAKVRGGLLPYHYEWRKSTDGFNWGQIESTANFFSVKLPCDVGEGVYVKLSVTSSDGQESDFFKYVEAAEQWPGQQGDCPAQLPLTVDEKVANNEGVYPNPAVDFLRLRVKGKEINIQDIEIIDSMGNKMRFELNRRKRKGVIQISTSHLKDGMYFLKYGAGRITKFIKSTK